MAGIYNGNISLNIPPTEDKKHPKRLLPLTLWIPVETDALGTKKIELKVSGPDADFEMLMEADITFETMPQPYEITALTFKFAIPVSSNGDLIISFHQGDSDQNWQILKRTPVQITN